MNEKTKTYSDGIREAWDAVGESKEKRIHKVAQKSASACAFGRILTWEMK